MLDAATMETIKEEKETSIWKVELNKKDSHHKRRYEDVHDCMSVPSFFQCGRRGGGVDLRGNEHFAWRVIAPPHD